MRGGAADPPGSAAGPRPSPLVGEELPPEPRQQRSRRTQEAVLEAALALFAERGYDGTSMADIAAGADAAVGAVYRHYRTKRQLLLVLVDRMLAEIEGLDLTPVPGPDPVTTLAHTLRRAIETDSRYVGAYRAWVGLCARDPQLAAVDREINDWTARRLAAVLRAVSALPGARPGLDVDETARLLALLFWRLLLEPDFPAERTVAAVTVLLRHVLLVDDVSGSAS